MTKNAHWPSKLFLSIRTAQLLVGITSCVFASIKRSYTLSFCLSFFTIMYVFVTLCCFFILRPSPAALAGVDFALVFLWGAASGMVVAVGQQVTLTLVLVAVGIIEMMLFVVTMMMAAAVMYRCRYELREEAAVLNVGADTNGTAEIPMEGEAAGVPVTVLSGAGVPTVGGRES